MRRTHFFIITPSYNQAQFIEKTLDSVVAQKGDFSVSLVVMDGGSTDETVEVLKKFELAINHQPSHIFKWVSEKDKGQTDAINKGIEQIKKQIGKKASQEQLIFAYLNSDDYYLPGAFQKVVAAFAQHPTCHWLVGDAVIVNEQGNEIQKPIRWYKQLWRLILFWSTLLILNPIPQPATFIRWSSVQETGPFNDQLRYVMDYEYWLRLHQHYGRPLQLNKPLAAFRIHGQSKGGSQFEKQFAEEFWVAKKFTHNSVLLMLHQLHSTLIVLIYKWLK